MWRKKIIEEDMLEKTFTIFHALNVFLPRKKMSHDVSWRNIGPAIFWDKS